MPATDPDVTAEVVRRLRAAGCVFAEDEAAVLTTTATSRAELDAMIERRATGVPLELVVGWAEFCGARVAVEEGVFVPRRRSEFLAERAIALSRPGAVVVDLCCGAGALGVALARAVPRLEVHAADVDPVAVACARRNLEPFGGEVHLGDLYDALPARLAGRVNVLVVNAPYVPTEELPFMPAEARLHEPSVALDGGTDGVQVHRRIAAGAAAWLGPGGHLLIETSERQAALTKAAVEAGGLRATVEQSGAHEATVVTGTAA